MDNGGKIIWAKHNDIQTANVKASMGMTCFFFAMSAMHVYMDTSLTYNIPLVIGDETKDGDRIPCSAKDLGSSEVYPQTLQHSPNGRFVVVCGDGEYIIYTALAWRNKTFGSGLEFVWALDSNEYGKIQHRGTCLM